MIATPDQRLLSLGEYLVGALSLIGILAPLVWASWRIRAAVLPGWSGAPARLAEVVIGVSLLVVLAELLGTFGAFGEVALIAASIAIALLAIPITSAWMRRPSRELAPSLPVLPAASVAKVLAVVGCAGVFAGWAVPTLGAFAAGMDRADTLWYHMPLSASFAQTGHLGQIFYFDPIFFASFYPANSELLHAVPILTFDRDIVSPLLNLGFLAMGLLGAWCIGRPWGVAPQAMLGAAIALGSQSLIEFDAGEALNDIVGAAFVLAAAGLIVNAFAIRGTLAIRAPGLAVAGLATGLAAGTKISLLPPVAAITLGVFVIARSERRRTLAVFLVPLFVTSAYWYLRNLIVTGNPMPLIGSIGPIDLPAPARDFELRPGFSVAHYWDDTEVWREWFAPGLRASFGTLWPVTLLATVGSGLAALWFGREPALRMLGGLVLAAAAAYVLTPLSAAGEEGEPAAFVWNMRFLAPAVALGLALLPTLPVLRATPRRRALVALGLFVMVAFTVGSLVQWDQGHTKGAIAAGVCVAAGSALWWVLARSNLAGISGGKLTLRLGLATSAVTIAIAAGYAEERHYLTHRYENTSPELKLAEAIRWARDLRDARVAIAGVRGVFNQYPFYGTDLSNEVQWLGRVGAHDAFFRIPTCEEWRRALNEGNYTHVVTTYDPYRPGRLTDTKEALWTREASASQEILREGPVSVFQITGRLHPAGCLGLPDLTGAELNGDSIGTDPEANQPFARDLAPSASAPASVPDGE